MTKKGISRRDFLRMSAVGVGTLLVPDVVASTLHKAAALDDRKIPTRVLGRTGIEVPILSMGVMRADNPNVVRAAYNSGIFHFDTAHGYQRGRNEELLGTFFEGKPRDSFLVGTKVKCDYPCTDSYEQDLEERFALSMSRLKMDYVDIFYAHDFKTVENVKDPRVIAAMRKIKESGRAKFLGFSTHAHKPELLDAAVEAGIYDVILVSYNFKLANIPETEAAFERAHKAGIGLVIMKSMAGGVEDAEGKKVINARACLKWVWRNPHITTVIPGFSNFDELDQCLEAAADPLLNAEEQGYLAGLREGETIFCQQCNACAGQCPSGLPIPDIMRAYMYTYGYKFAQLSKETLAEVSLPQDACNRCEGECTVRCLQGFDVGAKIAAIKPVMNIPDEFLS